MLPEFLSANPFSVRRRRGGAILDGNESSVTGGRNYERIESHRSDVAAAEERAGMDGCGPQGRGLIPALRLVAGPRVPLGSPGFPRGACAGTGRCGPGGERGAPRRRASAGPGGPGDAGVQPCVLHTDT